VLAAGCFTGERPGLESTPVIDDAAAAVVIERLERIGSRTFTATYDIIPSTTGETTIATVRQDDGLRRITIGDVEYVTDGSATETCLLPDGGCAEGIDDARVSNLNITHQFWSDAFATRLAIDASRRVGFSEGRTDTIAGRSAVCADIPLMGGEAVYCALDDGVLARYFGGDVSIELTSFENAADLSS